MPSAQCCRGRAVYSGRAELLSYLCISVPPAGCGRSRVEGETMRDISHANKRTQYDNDNVVMGRRVFPTLVTCAMYDSELHYRKPIGESSSLGNT